MSQQGHESNNFVTRSVDASDYETPLKDNTGKNPQSSTSTYSDFESIKDNATTKEDSSTILGSSYCNSNYKNEQVTSTAHPVFIAPSVHPSDEQPCVNNTIQLRQHSLTCITATSILKKLLLCASCQRVLRAPVTLPCGHSFCLACLLNGTVGSTYNAPDSSVYAVSGPSLTPKVLPEDAKYLPPRLPISSTTVPCAISTCSRNALGRGVGLWAGYSAIYGSRRLSFAHEGDTIPNKHINFPVHPGIPPVDGFIVGMDEHPFHLKVTGPWPRRFYEKSPENQASFSLFSHVSSVISSSGIPYMTPYQHYNSHGRSYESSFDSSKDDHFVEVGPFDLHTDVILVKIIDTLLQKCCPEENLLHGDLSSSHILQKQNSTTTPSGKEKKARVCRESSGDVPNQKEDRNGDFQQLEELLVDLLECNLCFLLLYEPLTLRCGHTFCHNCILRSLDHSSLCPICRTKLPTFSFFHEHNSNAILVRLLTCQIIMNSGEIFLTWSDPCLRDPQLPLQSMGWSLNKQYAERAATLAEEKIEENQWIPIFPCTIAFPKLPTRLHIFEPRYRLMIRRCLERSNSRRNGITQENFEQGELDPSVTSPVFGMVLPLNSNMTTTAESGLQGIPEYGTLLEIKSHRLLPDGRSFLETIGTKRFRILRTDVHDGYTVGLIESFDDISSEEETIMEQTAVENSSIAEEGAQELTTSQLVDECFSFVESMGYFSKQWLMPQLTSMFGPLPSRHEVSKISYWMALVL